MEDYKNTLWKSKKRKYAIYAIVRQSSSNMVAWEMEIRSGGLYHPAYGLIPLEYVSDYDIFTPSENKKYPEYIISLQESQYYYVGSDIKQIVRESI